MSVVPVVRRSGQRSATQNPRLAPLARWVATGVWDVLNMAPQACLHVGCHRQHPVINAAELLKCRTDRKPPSDFSPPQQGTRRAATVDPMVAAAIAEATNATSSTSARALEKGPCLLLGVDARAQDNVVDANRYPGLSITANIHHTELAKVAIQRYVGTPRSSGAIEPMFDLLVSDALSPPLFLERGINDEDGSRGTSGAAASNALTATSQDMPDTVVPFQSACREPVVVCPVRASLAVGLPFLKTGGAIVLRASYHHHTPSSSSWGDQQQRRRTAATQVSNLNGIVADLRYRFGLVELYRDAHGMVLVAVGDSAHTVGDMPYNLREDFPGFLRGVRRPRQWNPMEPRAVRGAKQRFFMALHPSFDRAPTPSALEFGLAQEKARAERADQQGGAYDDLVSRTLDEFKDPQ